MNILIPVFFLRHGRIGGVEQAMENLIEGLSRAGASVTIVKFYSNRFSHNFNRIILTHSIDVIEFRGFESVLFRIIFENLFFLFSGRNYSAIVFFNGLRPFFVSSRFGKIFTFVHDVQYKDYPSFFPPMKRLFLDFVYHIVKVRPGLVVFVSDFSMKKFQSKFRIAKDRCLVLHNSVNIHNQIERESFTPSKPYILCIANNYPNKNLTVLLSAWAKCSDILGDTLNLHIVGDVSGRYSRTVGKSVDLSKFANELGVQKSIVFESGLASHVLAERYRQADFVVCPSVYEGFGMPVAEALCFGKFVLRSDIDVFSEICKDSWVVKDYRDPKDWGEEIIIRHTAQEFVMDQEQVEYYRNLFSIVQQGNRFISFILPLGFHAQTD